MLSHRLRDARGSVLIPAMLVMAILLAFGMAAFTRVQSAQSDSRVKRESESSFDMAEALLNAEIFRLSTRWPDSTSTPYPATCTAASTSTDCPSAAGLRANLANADYTRPTSWSVEVHDNSSTSANFYSDTASATAPAIDANDDNFVWVRAAATVAGRRRVVVALVQAESVPFTFPSATLVAGRFSVSNNGNKVMIDTNGTNNEWIAGDIIVRCSPITSAACADWDKPKGQIEPDTVKSNPAQPPALSPDVLALMRAQATKDGNYYTGCAPSLAGDKPGEVVFMENANGCIYNGNNDYNTPNKPGYVVVANGSFTINGTAAFYGVMYHANLANSSSMLVNLLGNVSIFGSIVIDGPGGLSAGSSKVNLVYNPNATTGGKTVGTAGLVQNTFREIKPTR